MAKRSSSAEARASLREESAWLKAYNRREWLAPLTTVDMAIFAIIDHRLQVLLVERSQFPAKGQWALPGGFIDEEADDDVNATAQRKLKEKTGIDTPYLEQVGTVGNSTRDPRGWSVTILHFALIDASAQMIPSMAGSEPSMWMPVDEALSMELAFDHSMLLGRALERLRSRAAYTALPMRLMGPTFSLSELQTVFETVLGVTLEKKAFRRRVQDAGIVEECGAEAKSNHRPAALFRIGNLSDGFVFPRAIEGRK
jgi:8-oxo-dGTP diphosphatase